MSNVKTRLLVHSMKCRNGPGKLRDYVESQLRLQGRYYNKLVESERWFHREREQLRRRSSPAYRDMSDDSDAIEARIDDVFVDIKKRNIKFKALAATDEMRMKVAALRKELYAANKNYWPLIKALRQDDTYARQERDLLKLKFMYQKLAYNVFGEEAALFQKFHAGERLTADDCSALAHVFNKIAKSKAEEPMPVEWFQALAKAFGKLSIGQKITIADQDAIDALKVWLGNRERPEWVSRAGDYATLWWGTRLKTIASVEMAVKSKERDGEMVEYKSANRSRDGLISTALQDPKKLVTEEVFLSGKSEWVRAEVLKTVSGGRRKVKISIRIGSIGRAPLFIDFYTTLHRPWPPGAIVKTVTILRRGGPLERHTDPDKGPGSTMYLHRDRWHVQLTIQTDVIAAPKRSAEKGRVGVDLAWRVLDSGEVRVATWTGVDAATPFKIHPALARCVRVTKADGAWEYGEVVLPARADDGLLGLTDKVEDLLSILDRAFDEVVAQVVQFRETQTRLPADHWFIAATNLIHKWGSRERLVRGVGEWHRRVPGQTLEDRLQAWEDETGDSLVILALLQWVERQVHLEQYATGTRGRGLRWRKNLYRNVAAMLADRYAAAFVSGADFRVRFRKRGSEADGGDEGMRTHNGAAALGSVRECLAQAHTNLSVLKKLEAAALRACPACKAESRAAHILSMKESLGVRLLRVGVGRGCRGDEAIRLGRSCCWRETRLVSGMWDDDNVCVLLATVGALPAMFLPNTF